MALFWSARLLILRNPSSLHVYSTLHVYRILLFFIVVTFLQAKQSNKWLQIDFNILQLKVLQLPDNIHYIILQFPLIVPKILHLYQYFENKIRPCTFISTCTFIDFSEKKSPCTSNMPCTFILFLEFFHRHVYLGLHVYSVHQSTYTRA